MSPRPLPLLRRSGEPFEAQLEGVPGAEEKNPNLENTVPERSRPADQNPRGDEWWGNGSLLSAIGNNVVNGILAATPDRAVRWVNPAFSRLTGYTSLEMVGKTLPSLQAAIHAPDFYQELSRAIEAGITWYTEVWIRAKDGSEFLQETTITPVADSSGGIGFVAVLGRPVIGHYESEPEIRSDEELAGLALELSNQGLWEWNLVTGKDYLSPTFRRLLGYPPRQTEEGYCGGFSLIHSDDLAAATRSLLAHLSGRAPLYQADVRLRKANGEYLRVFSRGRVTKWDKSGQPCQIAGIHSESSAGAGVEQELQRAHELGALGLMAAGVVHDLNNLLTVNITYGNLLQTDPQIPESFREKLRAIGEASELGVALIRPLLSFKRSKAEPLSLISPNEVISSLSRLLQYLLAPTIELATHLDTQLGEVRANTGQLQQVILNLVGNARDAMPQGGPLEIATCNLQVEAGLTVHGGSLPAGSYVLLTITDSGAGMDETACGHLFEPFYSTKQGGSGLGLSTVDAILKQLGGGIWISTAQEMGTTVKVYLPRADSGSTQGSDNPHCASVEAREEGDGSRLLVVEDPSFAERFARETLTAAGFRVLATQNSKEALSLAQQDIALAIIDMMPSEEPVALILELRRSHPSLPVIVLSDKAALYARISRALGVNATLSKPVSAEQLIVTVNAILRGPGDRT
jgi:two-component system, cell cycle sensor histidine kinase and response regulator CckA